MANTIFTGRYKGTPKGRMPSHFVTLCLCDMVTNKVSANTLTLMVDPGDETDLEYFEKLIHKQVEKMFARLAIKNSACRAPREKKVPRSTAPIALLTAGTEVPRG